MSGCGCGCVFKLFFLVLELCNYKRILDNSPQIMKSSVHNARQYLSQPCHSNIFPAPQPFTGILKRLFFGINTKIKDRVTAREVSNLYYLRGVTSGQELNSQ